MVDARVLHRMLLLFILVGLAFSLYATFEVLDPSLQGTCSVNSFVSCSAVDQSGYTHLGPFPDWSVGVAGFVLLLALDIPLFLTFRPAWLYGVLGLSLVGVAVSAYLAYLELGVIHALCPICLGAYISNLLVLGTALWLRQARAGHAVPQAAPAAGTDP